MSTTVKNSSKHHTVEFISKTGEKFKLAPGESKELRPAVYNILAFGGNAVQGEYPKSTGTSANVVLCNHWTHLILVAWLGGQNGILPGECMPLGRGMYDIFADYQQE